MDYFQNSQIVNQLMRQKDNIDNLLSQYSQPPIQNVINASGVDIEAKILTGGENPANILINRRTLFVDEANHQVVVKELDGTFSKTYEIVVPKDAKDLRIEELEKEVMRLKEGNNGRLIDTKPDTKVEPTTRDVSEVNG